MKQLHCPRCRERVFFEQTQCRSCGTRILFEATESRFRLLDGAIPCSNRTSIGCNWAADPDHIFCASCRLTRTTPHRSIPKNIILWRRVEQAKRRLVYDLERLQLPWKGNDRQVVFDILSEGESNLPVMTGHLNGVITLSLSEADDAERELRRSRFREPYRTLLGHFRHEIGHFYWDTLVNQTRLHDPFRLIFGDERQSYEALLQAYHARTDYSYDRRGFISEYATSHPWEDWAETFAHFLHIVSTLETASELRLSSAQASDQTSIDPYRESDFDALLSAWTNVNYTMNELNRSMGLGDGYPFEISSAVRGKLHFVHMAILSFRKTQQSKTEEVSSANLAETSLRLPQ